MKTAIVSALSVLVISTSQATVLTFDDLPVAAQVGELYASYGVHFSPTDFGVQEGLANGDSGNWGLNGTVGPYFDGFNGSPAYSMTLTFDSPVTAFALDASRSNGSQPGDTLTVSGYLGATLINTTTILFGQINTWTTVPLSGSFDRVQWAGSGTDFHPYGVDNVRLTVPEPSGLVVFAGAGLIFRGWRKLRGIPF